MLKDQIDSMVTDSSENDNKLFIKRSFQQDDALQHYTVRMRQFG